MLNYPRAKPIAPRLPFQEGKPWDEHPHPRTKQLYEYQPSRKSPIRTKSLITFLNKTSDIEGSSPMPRIAGRGRETSGLIHTPIDKKKSLVCTELEKDRFLQKWTRGPPPLTETHGHAIGKGEIRDFIRNQIETSVGACLLGHLWLPTKELQKDYDGEKNRKGQLELAWPMGRSKEDIQQ